MGSWRDPLVIVGAALAVLGLAGCADSPEPGPSASASSSPSTPAPSASGSPTPLAADDLALPAQIDGWSAQESPPPAPTTIDNTPAVMQTGVYSDGTGTRLVTLIATRDKGYLESLRKKTSDTTEVGASVCGAPQDVPQAVTCTRELTGGLIQVTATGPAAEELGAFTNGLYDSLG